MKVNDIELPKYTLAQELWNSISHGLGTVLTLIFGPFMLIKVAKTGDVLSIVAVSIFILTLLLLFTMSCLYHSLAPCKGKKVLRVIDHDMVFALIMGTYTPFCWIGLRTIPGEWFPWGWVIFGVVWAGCILGIVMNSINIKKYAILSMAIYVVLGSAVIVAFYPVWKAIGATGTLLLLAGGVMYWVGAVLYNVGKKKSPWWHTVFHFFVLAGTFFMFFSIYYYVLA